MDAAHPRVSAHFATSMWMPGDSAPEKSSAGYPQHSPPREIPMSASVPSVRRGGGLTAGGATLRPTRALACLIACLASALLASMLISPQPAAAETVLIKGPYALRNAATGKCIDIPGRYKGTLDGPVNQYTCNDTELDNQRFSLLEQDGNHNGHQRYLIRNVYDN